MGVVWGCGLGVWLPVPDLGSEKLATMHVGRGGGPPHAHGGRGGGPPHAHRGRGEDLHMHMEAEGEDLHVHMHMEAEGRTSRGGSSMVRLSSFEPPFF